MIVRLIKGRLGKVIVVITMLLLLLPEALRFAVVKIIAAEGLGEATIENVDLNLFTGTVAVDGFSLAREQQEKVNVARVSLNIALLRLLFSEIHLQQLELDGLALSVIKTEQGEWEVVLPLAANDQPEAEPEEPVTLPLLGLDQAKLNNVTVKLVSKEANGLLEIKQLALENLSTWQNLKSTLVLDAAWNDAPIRIDISATPIDPQPTLKGSIKLDKVGLQQLAPLAGQAVLGNISLSSDFNAYKNKAGDIVAEISADLSLEQMNTAYKQLGVASQKLAWQGSVDLAMVDDGIEYTVQGDAESSGLSIRDDKEKIALISWERFAIKQFSVDELLNTSVEELQLENVTAINDDESDEGKFYIGQVGLKEISLKQGNHLMVSLLQISDIQYQVVVTPSGELRIQTLVSTLEEGLEDTQDAAQMPDDNSSAEPFVFTIKKSEIVDGGKIVFTDHRFAVPVREVINIKKFSVLDHDSANPEVPFKLDFEGSLGEFSTLLLTGEATIYSEEIALDFKGEFDAIPLPVVSPYTEAYLGYHLTRGQYDHTFELTIDHKDILLDNQLFLRQLKLKPVDPDKAQPMDKQLDVPLGFALNMLRDSNDNIELDVPIKGRMDQPDINIDDVVNDALAKALRTGATSYLTLALQPYGAVLMAADYVGGQLSTIKLDPIDYADGAGEMTQEQQAYVDKIGNLMLERPKLKLTICGTAGDSDREALQTRGGEESTIPESALIALADIRGKQVKRRMTEQGIKSRRLFLCQPAYQAEAISGVTLTM
ncbi:DUF748 domain-containing protein [Oceanicoccus sagamiensis]|uniref:DUF748 domain-containing protein n=1 Tax=Oceanicoccus sagamiensis TaxID=716816 RepID=A0A1X9NHV0_9GAMM|nr:DUF748 domain-containing protein [Oceanicoccus sagamiensis]ARN73563.1 hypothetical protein BST96_05175 [Oceanicoccus sagamiensis]